MMERNICAFFKLWNYSKKIGKKSSEFFITDDEKEQFRVLLIFARFARIFHPSPPWPLKTKNFLEILSIFLNKRRICQLTTTSRKKPSCVHNTINICRRHSRINNPQNKFCFKYPVYALLELFLSFMAWYKKTNTFSSTEVSRDRLTSAFRRKI